VPVIERRLRILILIYLWGALAEDSVLFVMSWLAPELWFRLFHQVSPTVIEIAFLRRSGGQWAAFALAQAITLWRWRRQPVWLAVTAGVRFSDLFTDISYLMTVPFITTLGWCLLTPPALLNLVGIVIMFRGYEQTRKPAT
jgi:hypothetical protein